MSLIVYHLEPLIPTSRSFVKGQYQEQGYQKVTCFSYVSLWLFYYLIYASKNCNKQKLSNLGDKRPNLASRHLNLTGAMAHLSLPAAVKNSAEGWFGSQDSFSPARLHLPSLRAFITCLSHCPPILGSTSVTVRSTSYLLNPSPSFFCTPYLPQFLGNFT